MHLEVVKPLRAGDSISIMSIANDRPISPEQAERYAAEGARQIGLTDQMLEAEFGDEAESSANRLAR